MWCFDKNCYKRIYFVAFEKEDKGKKQQFITNIPLTLSFTSFWEGKGC